MNRVYIYISTVASVCSSIDPWLLKFHSVGAYSSGNIRTTSHFRQINVTFANDVAFNDSRRGVKTYYVFKYWISSNNGVTGRWLSPPNSLSTSNGNGEGKDSPHVYYAVEYKPHHTIDGLLIDEVITIQVARVSILVSGDPKLLFFFPTDAKKYTAPVNLSTKPSHLAKVSGMY